MERRLHLPNWVKDRFKREKHEQDRQKAEQLEAMRRRAMQIAAEASRVPVRTGTKPSSCTRKVFDRPTNRRRGKRAKLARRGKPTHSFRIHPRGKKTHSVNSTITK